MGYRYVVYTITNPFNEEIIWVGYGGEGRPKRHFDNSKINKYNSNPEFYELIGKIKETYGVCGIDIIHKTNSKEVATELEEFLIQEIGRRYNKTGTLYNLFIGGKPHRYVNGYSNPETLERFREMHKERRTPIYKEDLEEYFNNQKLTRCEIAEIYGVSEVLIQQRLIEYNIRANGKNKGKKFKGYYHTPFGMFDSSTKLEDNGISANAVARFCKNPDTKVEKNFNLVIKIHGEECVGKTFKELGWWFEPKES